MDRRAGFTLLELLVVIAIIALLMAVLTPALDRAKSQAKEATCLSNLHQWYLVFVMYADDWNNSFMEGNVGGDEDQPVQWYNVTRPYYKDPELMLCPADPSRPEADLGPGASSTVTFGLTPAAMEATASTAGPRTPRAGLSIPTSRAWTFTTGDARA
jgi:prepilin-type N-terminal cleavage/methylation domain-containing protein